MIKQIHGQHKYNYIATSLGIYRCLAKYNNLYELTDELNGHKVVNINIVLLYGII